MFPERWREQESIGFAWTPSMGMSTVFHKYTAFIGHTCANIPTDGQMHEAVAAIAACGVSPVVRIAANESWMVKRMHSQGTVIKP